MTSNEVYTAICKSSSEQCYAIVYLINNDEMEDAVEQILDCFDCSKEAAEEVANMFKVKLEKSKAKIRDELQ